jgi:3-oxoacyl-[acyl-carrier protein] reductase
MAGIPDSVEAAHDLTGRVAVVTGAGSGIGRASAHRLAEAGATVVCADIDGDGAQATADAITDRGDLADAAAVDVTDRAAVDDLVAGAVERHGRLDVMANIAGIIITNQVVDISEEEYDRVLGVNLKGPFFGCQAAARVMVEQGSGSIINMVSAAIDAPAPNLAGYGMSKAGLAQLTRVLAQEVGPAGVRVNAVAPGFIITEMTTRNFTDADGNVDANLKAEVEKRMSRGVPLRRVGQPDEIAWAVLFLASDASSFMTGQILRPNGGAAMPI